MALQRHTAYKIQVGDIHIGKPIFDGDRFSALECSGRRVARTNLLGNVIDKYLNEEKKYCTLTIDDGSGQIRIKGFSDQYDILKQPEIGDTILIIGMIRFFNNEIYVLPEIIKKVDPKWLHIRRLEVGVNPDVGKIQEKVIEPTTPSPQIPAPQPVQSEPIHLTQEKIGEAPKQEEKPKEKIESPKLKALEMIRKEKEVGIEKLKIFTGVSQEELNQIVNDLITEGEIYELKPGYLCSVN